MKLWSDFYDYVSPDVPGCPQNAQAIALRFAAIAFCEQSLSWSYDHPDVAVVVATPEYPFVPPDSESVVHAITYAEFNGAEIGYEYSKDNIYIYDWRNKTGTPDYVIMRSNLPNLKLIPVPDVAGTLKMSVALKPSLDSTGIDDSIFNEYRDAIVHGALARLMLSPKKPYTDGQLAQYHKQQFQIMTGQAGTRTDRDGTREPLRTTIMRRR